MASPLPRSVYAALPAGSAAEPGQALVTGLENLLPPGLTRKQTRAWLSFPIAGDALWRRLLSLFVNTTVVRVVLPPSPAAHAFAELASKRRSYDLDIVVKGALDQTVRGNAFRVRLAGLPTLGFGRLEDWSERLQTGSVVATDRLGGVYEFARDGFGLTQDYAPSAERAVLEVPVLPFGSAREAISASTAAMHRTPYSEDPGGVNLGGVLFGPRCSVHRTVVLRPPVSIGADSRIGKGAVIGPGAAIGARSFVGERARIENAVLLDCGRLRPGEILRGAVLHEQHLWMGGTAYGGTLDAGTGQESDTSSPDKRGHEETTRPRNLEGRPCNSAHP